MKKNFNEWFNSCFIMPTGFDQCSMFLVLRAAWKESRRQTLIEILKMAQDSYNYDVIDCIRPMLSEVVDNESK